MKLVEEIAGMGELLRNGESLCRVSYRVLRYQGMTEGSGLPIPGLFRIEGSIDVDTGRNAGDWVGIPLSLRLDDGRVLGIRLVSRDGRILSEGHGPMKCLCC